MGRGHNFLSLSQLSLFLNQIQVDGDFKNKQIMIKCTPKENRMDRKNQAVKTFVFFDTEVYNQVQSQINFQKYDSSMKFKLYGFCFVEKSDALL